MSTDTLTTPLRRFFEALLRWYKNKAVAMAITLINATAAQTLILKEFFIVNVQHPSVLGVCRFDLFSASSLYAVCDSPRGVRVRRKQVE